MTSDPTREAQRKIVRDWLDTGYETGRREYDELLDRLAALPTTPAPDPDHPANRDHDDEGNHV